MDDAGFAEKPFGTGPFRLLNSTRPANDGPREMIFVDNAGYGRWRDRTGLPHIREIRFIEVTRLDPISRIPQQVLDPLEAFRAGRLHILTDVPTGDLEKFTSQSAGLGGRAEVVTAEVNRRVHILAVNLTRPNLQNKALRQMISMAIDREKILDEVFRSGHNYHRAMSGPYPPNSWAGGKGEPLVQRDAAVAKLKSYLADAGAKLEIELAYPIDDPRAEEACRKIKAAVEDVSKDLAGDRKLVVNLAQMPMDELLLRVQEEHNRFDLAYVPFDYPDDWYPYALGAALDPQAAGRGGRNWFHFQSPETNPDAEDLRLGQVLLGLRGYCDVSGVLAAKAAEAGRLFNESLPFIPLWQLDRHMIVSSNLKVFVDDLPAPVSPRLLNPTTLFQGVARWRLD
jgi:ABC-type oligopeptide transport system substrate-binding subunit